jgi:hypothetical protein
MGSIVPPLYTKAKRLYHAIEELLAGGNNDECVESASGK